MRVNYNSIIKNLELEINTESYRGVLERAAVKLKMNKTWSEWDLKF